VIEFNFCFIVEEIFFFVDFVFFLVIVIDVDGLAQGVLIPKEKLA
jgi:hypothetical protein